MNTYTTVLGDTWDMVAFRIWGKETYAKELIEANLDYVKITIFSAGIVLKVPSIDNSTGNTSSLPPWKQGVV